MEKNTENSKDKEWWRRERGNCGNRKQKYPSSSKTAWRRAISLLASHVLPPTLPPFLYTHTCIHPFILCNIHPSSLPSFLPLTLLQIIHASQVFGFAHGGSSPPALPPCFLIPAGNKRSDGQWLTLLPATPLWICVRGCEWRSRNKITCGWAINCHKPVCCRDEWSHSGPDDLHVSGETGTSNLILLWQRARVYSAHLTGAEDRVGWTLFSHYSRAFVLYKTRWSVKSINTEGLELRSVSGALEKMIKYNIIYRTNWHFALFIFVVSFTLTNPALTLSQLYIHTHTQFPVLTTQTILYFLFLLMETLDITTLWKHTKHSPAHFKY